MKDWEKVKETIINNISGTINTIEPTFDINENLDLFKKVINYKISLNHKENLDRLKETIVETLSVIYIERKMCTDSFDKFCQNFEPIIKQLYFILEEGEKINYENKLAYSTKRFALNPYLNGINNITRPKYIDSKNNIVDDVLLADQIDGEPKIKINKSSKEPEVFRLYPKSISFDKFESVNDPNLNTKYANSFNLYIIKAVLLKNSQSHGTPNTTISDFHSSLIAILHTINFFKKELKECFRTHELQNNNYSEHIEIDINRLKKQKSEYVSLYVEEMSMDINTSKGLIESLIEKNITRFRILGHGGSGKTTTIEYLYYQDCCNYIKAVSSKLPIYIHLGNIKSNETIKDFILKKINITNEKYNELIISNQLKIYLDGINEIIESRESKREKLLEISSIIDDNPKLDIIITDRYDFDQEQNNPFNIPNFQIQPLNEEQIIEFVTKACESEDVINDVKLKLDAKPNIERLLSKPLLLTRAIEIVKVEKELPENETKLIEKFIDILLNREKNDKKDPLLKTREFKWLYSYVADFIWTTNRSNSFIPINTFNKKLVEASKHFGLETSNAGYVIRIGYELQILRKVDEEVQFFHQNYIEYFLNLYNKYQYLE